MAPPTRYPDYIQTGEYSHQPLNSLHLLGRNATGQGIGRAHKVLDSGFITSGQREQCPAYSDQQQCQLSGFAVRPKVLLVLQASYGGAMHTDHVG